MNWLLIIFVTIVPGQPAQVFQLTGNYSYDHCRALIPARVQLAAQSYPAATITGQCLQMTP